MSIQQVGPGLEYATISDAVAASMPGDTIKLHDGVYRERVCLPHSLTLHAAEGTRPTLSGSRPVGPWEDCGGGRYRWLIPENWNLACGWLYADGKRLDEASSAQCMTPGGFSFHDVDLAAPGEDEVSVPVSAGDEGWLDLADRGGGTNGVQPLTTWLYVPKACVGGLRVGDCRPVDGGWPMAPDNDFYGFRRPDFPWPDRRQRARLWVNGKECRAWCKHAPRLEDVTWQKGWNRITMALEIDPGRRVQWRLLACGHRWADHHLAGMRSAAAPFEVTDPDPVELVMGALPITEYQMHPFYATEREHSLYVCLPGDADPNARLLTLSCLPDLITADPGVNNVLLRGLCFEESACHLQVGMVAPPKDGAGWRIEDCVFRESLGGGIAFSAAPGVGPVNHVVRQCRFEDNACLGIQGNGRPPDGLSGLSIENCRLTGNNWLHYGLGWHAAAIKLCRLRHSTIRECFIADNEANGIWLDWECVGNTIEHNTILRNSNAGIFLEACHGDNRIEHNTVSHTRPGAFGGAGIHTHDSCELLIRHNTLTDNAGFGFQVGSHTDRNGDARKPFRHEHNVFEENRVSGNQEGCLKLRSGEQNRIDGNVYGSGGEPLRFTISETDGEVYEAALGRDPVCRIVKHLGLTAFRAATGHDLNSREGDA